MSDLTNTEQLRGDLKKLVQETPPLRVATPVPSKTAKPAQRGISVSGSTSDSTGIASPLAETSYNDRTYYAMYDLTALDGIMVIEVEPLATIDFEDANGNEVQFQYDDPANPNT